MPSFVRRFAAGHSRVLHRCRVCDDRIDDDAYRTEMTRDVANTTYVHEECAQEEAQITAEAEVEAPAAPTRKLGRKLIGGVADQLRGEFDSIKRLRDDAAERRQRREAEKKNALRDAETVKAAGLQQAPPIEIIERVVERQVHVPVCPECLAEFEHMTAYRAHKCAVADADIVSLKRAPVPTGRRMIAEEE